MKNKKESLVQVKMVSAITEAINFKKTHGTSNSEQVLKHISGFANREKNQRTKMAMIVAVSRALEIAERKKMTEKEIIRNIVPELPSMLEGID